MGFVNEFKAFAMRGNVIDMAVGIVIGAAFGKIVSSFVNDVLMPPIGLMVGGVDFSDLSIRLKDAVPAAAGVAAVPAVTLDYGAFLNTVLDFLIVAFAVFLVVKAMNMARARQELATAAPPAPSKQEVLLTEIRDTLRGR